MNRKAVYIVLVALAILLIVALLWWWFLRRETTAVQTTGTFGTAQNVNGSGTANGSTGANNIGSSIPQNGQASSQTNVSANSGGTINGGATTQTNIQLGTVGTGNASSGNLPAGTTANGTSVNTPGTITLQPDAAGSLGSPVVLGVVGVPDVVWLSGTPDTGTPDNTTPTNPNSPINTGTTTPDNPIVLTPSGPGTVFNPTPINDIVDSNPTGTGLIPNLNTGSNGQQVTSGLGLGGTAAIAAVAGALTCGASTAISAAMQAIGLGTATGAATTAQTAAGGAGALTAALSVSTFDIGLQSAVAGGAITTAAAVGTSVGAQNGSFQVDTFLGCVARVIAKVAINQITNSVVNWINSGFTGSPSFVQNPTAFFQQTADQAAGAFIQGSALSFLCSPFQLQIKIAIAQSYANRNSNSCTLTQISNNITSFMRGNFLSGNWAGMFSFTTMPTNNPYGAFLYGSIGLSLAANTAVGQKQQDLSQGAGFLSMQQQQNCHNVGEDQLSGTNVGPNKTFTELPGPNAPGQPVQYSVCDQVTTTPGTVIQNALIGTENSSLNSLNLAKSFDEIISALITQLLTRTLQSGLSNLSGAAGYSSNFYTADQLQAQSNAQALLTQMQAESGLAAEYANVQQGSISDIEATQSQLNDVYNCWSGITGSSTNATVAARNAAVASSTIISLNTQIDAYNNQINSANNAIVMLEQLQSNALSVQSTADVTSVTNSYNAALASKQLPSQNDVTNAQQTRTTLQSTLAADNAQASASLQQCNAL